MKQIAKRIVAMNTNGDIRVGDEITAPEGIDATDIPVGATVNYVNGVDRSNTTYDVRMRDGKKVLAIPGVSFDKPGYPDLFCHGQSGLITVLSLP